MKYKTDEHRAREGGALKAAQNLAVHACYRTSPELSITPPQLQEALNVPAQDLFLLPSGGEHPYRLEQAVRETRCTLLIIEPGSTMDGLPTFYFTLLRFVGGQVRWHRALPLWIHWDGALFLVPDPEDSGAEAEFFVLERGVRPARKPWETAVDRDFGLRHADAILLAP
ncbi:hypothetical protein GRI75_10600 [Altererythrobacter soli]|uniref:Uncharacterized protein n=1 Tax=Croceibacterium soli TaxID=1739690 RepID=A0A6I4UWF1_9SPHN|nr:hypothetical protein [Croceibacterium soli]MXP42089.1 hypothetical protein [Croceibacterium soli]